MSSSQSCPLTLVFGSNSCLSRPTPPHPSPHLPLTRGAPHDTEFTGNPGWTGQGSGGNNCYLMAGSQLGPQALPRPRCGPALFGVSAAHCALHVRKYFFNRLRSTAHSNFNFKKSPLKLIKIVKKNTNSKERQN